ncbi:MAG: hypothetical protein K6F17_04385 [Lachnospiraceae bacterium]|nr:hypothetical protein [Lachnospiraceae bacterium]
MGKKKKTGIRIIIIAAALMIIAIAVVVYVTAFKKVKLNKDYVKETYDYDVKLSESDIENIRKALYKTYREDDIYAGFSGGNTAFGMNDLVNAAVLKEAVRIGDSEVISTISAYYEKDIGNDAFYNMAISRIVGKYDNEDKYVTEIKDAGFKINNITDALTAASYFLPEAISKQYDIKSITDAEYKKYDFSSYSSDLSEFENPEWNYKIWLLSCIYMYDLEDNYDTDAIKAWVEHYKSYIEECIQSGSLEKSDYVALNTGRIYGMITNDYSMLKECSDEFFNTYDIEYGDDMTVQMLMSNATYMIGDYPEYDKKVSKALHEYIADNDFGLREILSDTQTYYGLILCNLVGFEYNKDKVASYVQSILESEDRYISDTYYAISIAKLIGREDLITDDCRDYVNHWLEVEEESGESSRYDTFILSYYLQMKMVFEPDCDFDKDDIKKWKDLADKYSKEDKEAYESINYILLRRLLDMDVPDGFKDPFMKNIIDYENLYLNDEECWYSDLYGFVYRYMIR